MPVDREAAASPRTARRSGEKCGTGRRGEFAGGGASARSGPCALQQQRRGRGGYRQGAVRGLDRARSHRDRSGDERGRSPSACSPAQTPTMSTIESMAPTSWKCTSSTAVAVDGGLGLGKRLERAQCHLARPVRAGRLCRSTSRMSAPAARVRLPFGEHAHAESAHAVRADALDDDAGLGCELGHDRPRGPRR